MASTYKVVDLLGTLVGTNIEWDGGKAPEGVEVLKFYAKDFPWFQSKDVFIGLRLMPHAVASFTLPAYYGVPESVLACTKVGCVKLEYVGMQPGVETYSSPWIIQIPESPKPNATVMQTWGWQAKTLGGPSKWCALNSLIYGKWTIVYTGITVDCCIPCPENSHPTNDVVSSSGVCSSESGPMVSFSTARGMPGNIIMGYYSTDQNFDFKTPTSIKIGGHTYHLYGFDSSSSNVNLKSEEDLISNWVKYENQDCFTRVVNITAIMLSRGSDNKRTSFSALWPSSSKVYVYVAAKGRSWTFGWWAYEYDYVIIRIYGMKSDGSSEPIGEEIVATDGFVDNSYELRTDPKKWAFNPDDFIGIEVMITYIMKGPKSSFIPCFTLGYCGHTRPERAVRLAFYVEIIPSEFLS